MNKDNPKVRFLGIGAQKCATTWLHDVLADHPQLCLPGEVKELDFFSYFFDYGWQWYERHFEHAAESAMCGEISPSYLHGPGVAERVAAYNPAMRIILMVRDPVERAVSNHRHEVRIGHFVGPDLSFEAGLRNNPAYIEQGLYAKHLRNWLQAFPQQQVMVLRFDEVIAEPALVLRRVCEFLGVDADYESPRLFEKSNESYLPRSGVLARGKNAIRGTLRAVGLGRIWELIGDAGLRERYRRVNRVKPEQVFGDPQPETLRQLRSTFEQDVRDLQQLSGADTSDWLKD